MSEVHDGSFFCSFNKNILSNDYNWSGPGDVSVHFKTYKRTLADRSAVFKTQDVYNLFFIIKTTKPAGQIEVVR